MTAAPLRVALIGAGRMGANHARVIQTVAGARLVGVHDVRPEAAAALAAQHGCQPIARLEDVAPACDAAIVATTSSAHVAVGRALLDAGVPCLIEKPLATDEAGCLTLIAAAARRGVALAVGHSERFNAATIALCTAVAGWRLCAIEARRLNPGSARIADIGVVSDLMVHDLDLVLRLLGSTPTDVAAVGIARDPAVGADHATALLRFGETALAACTASRITTERVRALSVTADRGTATVDYLARTVTVTEPGAAPRQVAVADADTLATEQATFLDTVRGSGPRSADSVAGADALEVLRVAWAIERRLASPNGP